MDSTEVFKVDIFVDRNVHIWKRNVQVILDFLDLDAQISIPNPPTSCNPKDKKDFVSWYLTFYEYETLAATIKNYSKVEESYLLKRDNFTSHHILVQKEGVLDK